MTDASVSTSKLHYHIEKSPQADLSTFNTMRLSCIANELIIVNDESQVEKVIFSLTNQGRPLFILSGGSNVLLPPKLNVSVIKPNMKGIKILSETDDYVDIEVMAGEVWHNLVVSTVCKGWYGLENLALIPGLTGAAPVQNIGAYGVQLDDCMTHVRAFHLPTQTWHQLDTKACGFGYRDSKFKRDAGQWFITRVGFRLHKNASVIKAHYGDVAQLATNFAKQRLETQSNTQPSHSSSKRVLDLNNTATPIDVMNAIISIRQSKLPSPQELPNCGSFFKNPIINSTHFSELQKTYPNIVGYSIDAEHTKVAAGWLIDNAGLKGQGIKPIMTHTKQALVLVNHANINNQRPATQADVLTTQQWIQDAVKNKYHINLEREPVWIDELASYNIGP